jgi:tryptophan synthase alpha chain
LKTIDEAFKELKSDRKKALIPFFTAGYPDMPIFLSLVREASKCGADLIEIGIPFSDPIADGPTIQHSSARSLDGGVTLAKVIEAIKELSASVPAPLLVMSYLNPILRMGVARFVSASSKAGVAGLIVPDLPLEESDLLRNASDDTHLTTISFLAPTSSQERIKLIASRAEGFIYLVSLTGVTGAKDELPETIPEFVTKVREHTELPICVGFGISQPRQAGYVSKFADGVIIGSAIVEIIREGGEQMGVVSSVGSFLTSVRSAMDSDREAA